MASRALGIPDPSHPATGNGVAIVADLVLEVGRRRAHELTPDREGTVSDLSRIL